MYGVKLENKFIFFLPFLYASPDGNHNRNSTQCNAITLMTIPDKYIRIDCISALSAVGSV